MIKYLAALLPTPIRLLTWLAKKPEFKLGLSSILSPSQLHEFKLRLVDAGGGFCAFETFRFLVGGQSYSELVVSYLSRPISSEQLEGTLKESHHDRSLRHDRILHVLIHEKDFDVLASMVNPLVFAQSRATGVVFILLTDRWPVQFGDAVSAQFFDQRPKGMTTAGFAASASTIASRL